MLTLNHIRQLSSVKPEGRTMADTQKTNEKCSYALIVKDAWPKGVFLLGTTISHLTLDPVNLMIQAILQPGLSGSLQTVCLMDPLDLNIGNLTGQDNYLLAWYVLILELTLGACVVQWISH